MAIATMTAPLPISLFPFSSSHSRFLFYHLSCQFQPTLRSK
ncbi:hypothetical protein Gogos_015735 [Gossypium gossypioides]|uniref:Uncharacterized protein n=1 Tax=Gossypium gossypioides TaxID=34282 RepID=A0A7J9C2P5_GOSGO|nr:hypothetical protein [Gossypium gossypioides]